MGEITDTWNELLEFIKKRLEENRLQETANNSDDNEHNE